MRKILKFLGRVGMAMCAIAAGTVLVLKFPMVAIAFMAVLVAKKARNPYEGAILSAVASIAAAFLVFHVAELAIVGASIAAADAGQQWAGYIQTA